MSKKTKLDISCDTCLSLNVVFNRKNPLRYVKRRCCSDLPYSVLAFRGYENNI